MTRWLQGASAAASLEWLQRVVVPTTSSSFDVRRSFWAVCHKLLIFFFFFFSFYCASSSSPAVASFYAFGKLEDFSIIGGSWARAVAVAAEVYAPMFYAQVNKNSNHIFWKETTTTKKNTEKKCCQSIEWKRNTSNENILVLFLKIVPWKSFKIVFFVFRIDPRRTVAKKISNKKSTFCKMRKMTEFQILDQVVPDSTSLQQRSIFQVTSWQPSLEAPRLLII